MKKILTALILAMCLVLPLTAESTDGSSEEKTKPVWDHGDNVSNMTYQNVRIYKILDQKDSYVILYAKKGMEIGQAVVPKKWAKETPRKLAFRKTPRGLNSYMTVIKKEDEFYKVWLTIPVSRNNSVWGIIENGANVDGTDADTLEIEY